MKKYPVLAEFVDVHTGERHVDGTFAPKDAEQFKRLVAARCLGEEPAPVTDKPIGEMNRTELEAAAFDTFTGQLAKMSDDELRSGIEHARERERDLADPADIVRRQLNEDGLFDETIEKLKEIAVAEKVDLTSATKKADIVAAIRATRAAA